MEVEMDKFLTIDEAAEYLSVSVDTIKRYVDKGELPKYNLDRALRFKLNDLDTLVSRTFEVLLTPGLRAGVTHVVQTGLGMDVWRVIVQFRDTTKEKRLISTFGPKQAFTEYHVYVTDVYLEDHAKLPPSPQGAEKFALRYIKERFDETADENGDRDITKIQEMQVACIKGECKRGECL